jgi:hypothetical protein
VIAETGKQYEQDFAATKKEKAGSVELAFRFSELKSGSYGFFGAITSFTALATRNFTTVLALIWMGSPV